LIQFAAIITGIYLGYTNRVQLRNKYAIPQNPVEDCLVWTCCACCATAQEGRHVDQNTGMRGVADPAYDYPNATYGSPDPRPAQAVQTAFAGAFLAFFVLDFFTVGLTGVWFTYQSSTANCGDYHTLWGRCTYGSGCADLGVTENCASYDSAYITSDLKLVRAMAFLAFFTALGGLIFGTIAAFSRNPFPNSKMFGLSGIVISAVFAVISLIVWNQKIWVDVSSIYSRGNGYYLQIIGVILAGLSAACLSRA